MFKDILGKDKGTAEINGKKYFFKRNDAYVEILVEKIADLFGLKHAHYFPITLYGKNYYLSEDLNYQGQFETAFDAGIEYALKDAAVIEYDKAVDLIGQMATEKLIEGAKEDE